MSKRQLTDKFALDCIQRVLSGREWDADTGDYIAGFVRMTGRPVYDLGDVDEDQAEAGAQDALEQLDLFGTGE